MLLILTTTDKKPDAVKTGNELLKKKLVACYNLLPIDSGYWWKGKIEHAKEYLLILKTQDKNFNRIEKEIKKLSAYQNPEIVAIKASRVSKKYSNWLVKETI